MLGRLSALVASIPLPHPTRVAVDGFSASGKTTLADELAKCFEGRSVIRACLDDFKRPWSERDRYDRTSGEGYYRNAYDYASIRTELLEPLGPGGSREYRAAKIDPKTQKPLEASGVAAEDSILIADGVFMFRPELDDVWDFRIFVDIGFDLVMERGVNRDAAWTESRESAKKLYKTRYIPSEKIYASRANPKRRAGAVVDNRDFENPELFERIFEKRGDA